MWHHLIGITGEFAILTCGYSIPSLAIFLILGESSSIFMSYRGMYKKEELGQLVPSLHTLGFFLGYTVFRIANFPFVFFMSVKSLRYLWSHLSVGRQFLMAFSIAEFFAIWLLNLYWYKKICLSMGQSLGLVSRKVKVQAHAYGGDEAE
jgi:hypothetical protein